MKFKDLYVGNKESVKRTLRSMWCSTNNIHSASQKGYAKQIDEMLDDVFAPQNAMPLVQCMNTYKQIERQTLPNAQKLIGGLWTSNHLPYVHQYDSWKALSETTHDGRTKSICVTTGTGSGKTECFMLPLISDLNGNPPAIEAIFLYPLNALMEDQKNRLNDFLIDTNLHFAVYNGNLPERHDSDDKVLEARIQEEQQRYPMIYPTREEMRQNLPNILLTNPTMLEYMLLRNKDQKMIANSKGRLKWIVIDETHTFSGAGAAELAMLIRRVLAAFDVKPENVRFATSSATIGNGADSTAKLKEFISGISGQKVDQIEIITGDRTPINHLANDEAERYSQKLFDEEFVPLDKLINNPGWSIEQRLEKLDELCTPEIGLKAKVHFFNRVLNQGFRVQLSDNNDGYFNISTTTPLSPKRREPYLELIRCVNCGEYLAYAQRPDATTDEYKPVKVEENDIFELDEMEQKNKLFFALSKDDIVAGDGNIVVDIRDNNAIPTIYRPNSWNIICNQQCKCPKCGIELGRKTESGKTSDEEMDNKKITTFRISSDFTSQMISRSMLNSVTPSNNGKPHSGQQYLSFVDSRQSAARGTLRQDIEEEKVWVYSTIYNELNKRLINRQTNEKALKQQLNAAMNRNDFAEMNTVTQQLALLQNNTLSWEDIYNLLSASPVSDRMCLQFVKRTKNSPDIDDNGNIRPEAKYKYISAVMVNLLARRPAKAAAPETLGLFASAYPALENIKECPDSVINFNSLISSEEKKIGLEDWKNLLHIFLDFVARSNMSIYLKTPFEPCPFDMVKDLQRYQTEKSPTSPINDGYVVDKSEGNICEKLLVKLLGDNNDVVKNDKKNISVLQNVMDDILKTLSNLTIVGVDPQHTESGLRLNLNHLGFNSYDEMCLCDVSRYKSRSQVLRPVKTLFKGYSPVTRDNKVITPVVPLTEQAVYPYIDGRDADSQKVSWDKVYKWGKSNRQMLFDNGLWGKYGCFTNLYCLYLTCPDIYIQAEHTAQVDKIVAKQSQDMFVDKEINILACSTTMEMGIDLGNLELVLLNSIPPLPSNYKQRAGRTGRDITNNYRSACVTLCGSDSIGLRTLTNPLGTIIERPTAIPFVDLRSKQVIQRHINAYLLRESQTITVDQNNNNLDYKLIDFFTTFQWAIDTRTMREDYSRIWDLNQSEIYPDSCLGDATGTKYQLLYNYIMQFNVADPKLNELLRDTYFENHAQEVVDNSLENIDARYDELRKMVDELGASYEDLINDNMKTHHVNKQQAYINLMRSAKAGRIRHKYCSLLATPLLEYFATNRFTPNANMPVNIIEFDVNFNNTQRDFHYDNPSNPSYPLQEALSQYAPGNSIVLSNRVRTVGGILYTGQFRRTNAFKDIYYNGEQVTINKELPSSEIWKVNGKKALRLIEPYAFIPEITSSATRVVEKNAYTRVNAQLIGTNDWPSDNSGMKLISIRSSDDSGEASILYYNVGIGYGYCVCNKCGKTVLEKERASSDGTNIPAAMIPEHRAVNDPSSYTHYNIRVLNQGRPTYCNDAGFMIRNNKLQRNVILGSNIQTDFCEIRIRETSSSKWLKKSDNKDSLMMTLAITFRQVFAEYLGIENRDIDFAIMPNGNICIFDTNPGGSGYSIRLAQTLIQEKVLDLSLELLKKIKSKDELLDKYTLRYVDDIDVTSAVQWLEAEKTSRDILPDVVRNTYPKATTLSYVDMIYAIKNSQSSAQLFVDANNGANYSTWNYKSDDGRGWGNRVRHIMQQTEVVSVTNCNVNNSVPIPIIRMMNQISGWAKPNIVCNFTSDGIYPVAYADGILYFVLEKECTNLDEKWCMCDLFAVEQEMAIAENAKFPLDVINQNNCIKIILNEPENEVAKIKDIACLVEKKCQQLITSFVDYVNTLPSSQCVHVTCQDEHLKSYFAVASTINFVQHFLDKINRNFSIEYKVEDYEAKDVPRYPKLYHNLNQEDRDRVLQDMTDEWLDYMYDRQDNSLEGYFVEFNPYPEKALPHWREISFVCGRKKLTIYPNGGVINDWQFDIERQKRLGGYIDCDNFRFNSTAYVRRRNPIMYDVKIEDL